MALPTKEELVLIETFRPKVAEILTEEDAADDMFLVRWLRARDLNMDKAEEMLRNAMKWRKENHLDDGIILDTPTSCFYSENFPFWIDGMDKDGRPVMTFAFGSWDVRKILKQGKANEFQSYLTHCYEEAARALKKTARMHPPRPGQPPITQTTCVYDWEGFAWGQLFSYQSVQNLLQLGAVYEAYYPETLYKCYFVNCPTLISSILKLLKPVIAARTMEKVVCLGTNKDDWKIIWDEIDPDQLRPQFGGTKTDNYNPFL